MTRKQNDVEQIALFPSALGWMALAGRGHVTTRLTFGHGSPDAALSDLNLVDVKLANWNPRLVKRLQAYAQGAHDAFLDVELDLGEQTDFQRRVVERCRRIGFGETMSYGELAREVGHPRAGRAVGNVMRTNRVPLIVPCHRVVGAGGSMCGYSAGEGTRLKLRLLEQERHIAAAR